jgi:short-subunit dehydrogenase
VLINNAGYGMIGAVEETPETEFRAQMDTNFFGALSVTKAALPYLRAQKSGAIVNVSSMGGQMSFAGASAYSASKFALEGLSEALAHEVAPFGIKVIIVEPGALRTNFSADSALKLVQVGVDPVAAVRAHAEQLLRDLATWEQVGSDVRIDPSAPDDTWRNSLDPTKRGVAA